MSATETGFTLVGIVLEGMNAAGKGAGTGLGGATLYSSGAGNA